MRGREPHFSSARSGRALTVLAFVAATLSGCITSNEQVAIRPGPPDIVDQIREVDLSPQFPQSARQVARNASAPVEGGARAASYYGDDVPATAGAQPNGPGAALNGPTTTGALTEGAQRSAGGQGYEMNFENAPVATVAKAILGDILGVG